MLDEYRRSFAPAFKLVFEALQQLSLAPTGRPEKSRTSLSGKLLRESARLSQVQDIAGCRVVVRSVVQQDDVIARLSSAFERLFVVDRRVQPSHGYRAVHAMVSVQGRTIEVQVRTELQHQWAEVSESLSDRWGVEVKYGGGPERIGRKLRLASQDVADFEGRDSIETVPSGNRGWTSFEHTTPADLEDQLLSLERRHEEIRERLKELFRTAMQEEDNQLGGHHAFPDTV